MSNDNLETFDDFIGGVLADFHTVDPADCLRFLEADEMAQATKLETHLDLGNRLQDHQETAEGITPDDPDWIFAEDIFKLIPQWFRACILIGKRLAREVREALNDAELQEILDDAELQKETLLNIYKQRRIAKRLAEAVEEYEQYLKKKAAANALKPFSKKRGKRLRNLFKSVLTSILLSVALSLIIRVASFELMKTPRNNYKP